MLVFEEEATDTGFDIWLLPFAADGSASLGEPPPKPLIRTPGNQTDPVISPSGQWIAYESDESGQSEIYVDRFPQLGKRVTISANGGSEPLWNANSNEIFYRSGDTVMSVSILETDPVIRYGAPTELFSGPFGQNFIPRHWDIHPDGDRFLMRERFTAAELRVVVNWFEELKRLVPVP